MADDDRVPIWLDCDPGHDDAFAILLAATHPRLNLLGISTVHGNSSLQKVTNNALSLLTAYGCPDVPVFPGARKPFMRPAVHAPDIHGKTGIDGTDLLPTPVSAAQTKNAAEAMRDAIMATRRGTCALVVTGTMTNAALLFAAFPETAEHIRCLSIMGGGFSVGNITPVSEFNIYCDPESASSIFTLPALNDKILMIPLDLTHQVLATPRVRTTILTDAPTPFRQMLHDLLMFFAGTYARVFGMTDGPPLHDPLAVAAVIAEELSLEFDWEEGSVEVVLAGGEMGRTLLKPVGAASENAHEGRAVIGDEVRPRGVRVRVGRGVDVARFWEVMVEAIGRADSVSPLNV
ncbi:Uridine nucleosidase 1 [Orbilia brochopaga]|uniref:Uridine nucleosidase 1 n=1 Tax=Orbilia brochopaga TaxID=3140254 RepID=A0AAV9U0V4_9PEZI